MKSGDGALDNNAESKGRTEELVSGLAGNCKENFAHTTGNQYSSFMAQIRSVGYCVFCADKPFRPRLKSGVNKQ